MQDLVVRKFKYAGFEFEVDLNSPFARFSGNPIVTPQMVNSVWKAPHLQVTTVHNAGIARYNDEVVMLFRSHLRNGISIIGLARSEDGLTDWRIDSKPVLVPACEDDDFTATVDRDEIIESESGGVEDPRIVKIDDTFLIIYSAYHNTIRDRVRVSLASTKDFKSFKRHGSLLDTDMRNVVIFPERINGKYVGLFRPNDNKPGDIGGIYRQISIGYTDDWANGKWKINERPLMKQSGGPGSMQDKIGPGAPPMKSTHGWLNIFHGVRTTMDGNPYVLGVALHEIEDPTKFKISNIPILFPVKADCLVSEEDYVHVPNVVFTCGALRTEKGIIILYYGGNDTVMNVAFSHEDVLAELCHRYPQDPQSGRPAYNFCY